MKYKIQDTITVIDEHGQEIREIIYNEFTEQEFLIKYLKNPDLMYWQIHDDGSRDYYRKNKHMATVDAQGNVTNIAGIPTKN